MMYLHFFLLTPRRRKRTWNISMCNPIFQAKMLNEAKTDLNVVVGLCVGHDSLFYKYSYRETIARTSNARCPNCHKKMDLIKKGDSETFVCVNSLV